MLSRSSPCASAIPSEINHTVRRQMTPSPNPITRAMAILMIGTPDGERLASYIYTGMRRMLAREEYVIILSLRVWNGYFM